MYLKSLDLYGFKSFANKTHLEFSPGITCIIGPNGTGKSNILDAILWVIGEQSPSTLRTKDMSWIIFSGTKLRKPLGYAEVSLLFSNEDRALDIDTSEVEIKRKLFLNQQSEYYINRNLCRLKDIRALFFNTGIGKTLYSVIQQNKIGEVLLKKPEERRIIFEEAAGISGFKQEEKDSKSELDRMDENLKTVQLDFENTKRQHDKLKVQAERVEEYNRYNEKLKNYETKLSVSGYLQAEKDKEKCENEIKKNEDRLAKIEEKTKKVEEEKAKIQAQIDSLREKRHEIELGIEKDKEAINGLNYKIFNSENQHKKYLDQQSDFKARYDAILKENKSNADEIKICKEEVETLRGKYQEIDKKIKSLESEIKKDKAELEKIAEKRTENEKEKQKCDNLLTSLCKEFALKTRNIINSIHSISKNDDKDSLLLEDKIKAQIELLYSSSTKSAIDKLKELFNQYLERNKNFTLLAASEKESIKKAQGDNDKIDDILKESSLITSNTEKLDKSWKEISERINKNEKELSSNQIERNSLIENGTAASTKLKMLQEQQETFASRLETAKKDYDESTSSIEELISEIKKDKSLLSEKQKAIGDGQIEISKLDKQVSKCEEGFKDLTIQTSDETKFAIKEDIIKLKAKLETLEANIKETADAFYETHGLSLKDEAEKSGATTSIKKDEIKAKISELKANIRSLGEMNHLAKVEYDEIKIKYDLLKTQLEDLNKAREDLKIVNQEIKDRSSKLFLESFEKINQEFRVFFGKLFSGGEGYLSLNGEDPLTCGVDIIAKPAGKEPKDIIALSGGEQTMTVFALLFAIYKIKAAPFCILDEVESALDKKNTEKFLNGVKEFENITQFIIITHNSQTVLGANTLLGTTQQEQGVTDVLEIAADRIGDKPVFRDAKTGKEMNIKLE